MQTAYEAMQTEKAFINVDAEESLIAAFVTGKSLSEKESLAATLSEEEIGTPELQTIYKCIKRLIAKGQNADLITVDAEIQSVVPEMYGVLSTKLVDIIRTRLSTISNADAHITVIKELAARRNSIKALQDALRKLNDPTQELDGTLDKLHTQTMQAQTRTGHEWHSITDVLLSTFNNLEKRANGDIKPITTGIPCIDKMIGGFYGGELTIIGARPSVGKSAFGVNIALEAAKDGYHVAFISREMSDVQFGQRLFSRQSGINGMQIRAANMSTDDWENISLAMSELSALPIDFMFSIRTIEDLRRECVKRHKDGLLDMVVVDYLQLMDTAEKTDSDHLRVGKISKGLKDIAHDLDIPVIALAQVNRGTDGQMPTLSSLKDSGSIEQDADGVIFLHKPQSADDINVYYEDKPYFDGYGQSGLVYLCIGVAKQRQGAIGKANVIFNPSQMRYMEIDRGK